MIEYLVTGFKNGVWCKISVFTIPELVEKRAKEKGIEEITYIEKA